MEKVLDGHLSCFAVPDVLTFLNMVRRTGVLVLERPAQESKLFFREGVPVFATSNKEDLRLGNMLVRLGRVPLETLEQALGRHRVSGHRIGQALLAERLLTEAELASFLKVQVSEVIFETFEWRQGQFSFWDKVPPPATAVTLEMDLQNLLMEGARRTDERERLSEVFPNMAAVVETVANPERIKESVTFTPEEWKVFFLVDGRRSLGEICRLAGNPDELATLQVLYNLLTANFVQISLSKASARVEEEAEPILTQKIVDGKIATPSTPPPVNVQFTGTQSRKVTADDTREVVTPKAVQYLSEAKQITVARLVLLRDGAESSCPLTKDSYTIGRHRNNDIVISDAKVSSFHARIDRTPEGFVLVDLNSRNGCFVNGRRVESSLLRTGDEIRLGTQRLAYKVDYNAPVGAD